VLSPIELDILPERFAICRLAPQAPLPSWAAASSLVSITRSADELSIVCEEKCVPSSVQAERDRQSLKVRGPLPFSATGILASLAAPLADAGVSIFVISTYDTDYLFVAARDLGPAVAALERAGHTIHRSFSE
jgi:uncharacterized protein